MDVAIAELVFSLLLVSSPVPPPPPTSLLSPVSAAVPSEEKA